MIVAYLEAYAALIGGLCYHVINRGNGRARVFHNEADYREFLKLLTSASDRLPLRLLAYCLMPNHVHLVLWPHEDGDLSRWMQWLMTTHVRRHHRRHGTDGHLWQGRFKAFPIQRDEHLLAVLRYVERNPLRAGPVERTEDWPWSSLGAADPAPVPPLHRGPVPQPANRRLGQRGRGPRGNSRPSGVASTEARPGTVRPGQAHGGAFRNRGKPPSARSACETMRSIT